MKKKGHLIINKLT